MPVPMAKMLGSKMMSSGGKPTSSVSIFQARTQIETRLSRESAWPFSSNAITITAAPYRSTVRACSMNASSPSFMLIEFTTPLPWRHCKPASITSQRDESIMTGTRAISGSDAISLRKCLIALGPSSRPSSMFTSMICAPFSTCCRATSNAAG